MSLMRNNINTIINHGSIFRMFYKIVLEELCIDCICFNKEIKEIPYNRHKSNLEHEMKVIRLGNFK